MWFRRDRRKSEQGGSLVTRRGGKVQGVSGRCVSSSINGAGAEVLRGNGLSWKAAAMELFCCVGREQERSR